MTTDYDVPRTDNAEQPLTELSILSAVGNSVEIESDDLKDWDSGFDEISEPTPDVVIVPPQPSEFTCSRCFLLIDLHRLADQSGTDAVCVDCADP
ncbi:DUF4193 family protein [Agromyces sp. NPDC058484]|uniref:DUF4193 family protein n=1 Tax=Agromyces sp. NPDC058484 TaxID=3346524 RepID=UPI00364A5E45